MVVGWQRVKERGKKGKQKKKGKKEKNKKRVGCGEKRWRGMRGGGRA